VGMACKLALFLALASGAAALAQNPSAPPLPPVPTGTVLNFQKPADALEPALPPLPAVPTPIAAYQQDKDKKDEKDKKDDKKFDDKKLTPEEQDKIERDKYVKLPPRDDVFAFPNDAQLEKAILGRLRADETSQMRDPFAKYPATLTFPPLPRIGDGIPYRPKTLDYKPMSVAYDALYVVHRRLHFEELNSERYGWDLGFIQPLVSTAFFYKDVLLWPNSLASGFCYGFYDTNVGKCLPGSPTPYMLYPPGLTVTGSVFEAVVITGAAFIFP